MGLRAGLNPCPVSARQLSDSSFPGSQQEMEHTATLHAGCELSSATGSGKKSNKGTGEGGDDQENPFSWVHESKGSHAGSSFFFFLVLFLTALPGNSLVPVLIQDEMVGWHHRLDGQEFEQAVRVGWTGRPGVPQSVGSQRVRHD